LVWKLVGAAGAAEIDGMYSLVPTIVAFHSWLGAVITVGAPAGAVDGAKPLSIAARVIAVSGLRSLAR
jgi:hypothetical protein